MSDLCWLTLTHLGHFWTCVGSCWLVSDSCWLVLNSCRTSVDSCWFLLTRVRLVLIRVDSCWLVLVLVYQNRFDPASVWWKFDFCAFVLLHSLYVSCELSYSSIHWEIFYKEALLHPYSKVTWRSSSFSTAVCSNPTNLLNWTAPHVFFNNFTHAIT